MLLMLSKVSKKNDKSKMANLGGDIVWGPTRRMLHDVNILVHFFNFSIRIITIIKKTKSIFFPLEWTLTLTPGMGVGWGPFRTKNPQTFQNISKNRKKNIKTLICSILFSPGRELWLTPALGMGVDHFYNLCIYIYIYI